MQLFRGLGTMELMVLSKQSTAVRVKPRPLVVSRNGTLGSWEEMKASRCDLTHGQAVQESADLSNRYRKMWTTMAGFKVDLDSIVRTLREKRIPFVLTGAYGIAGWTGRPRATHDVDILVRAGRNHARAVKALKELYPQLEVVKQGGRTAFFVPGEKLSVLDVVYPFRADQEITLATGIWAEGAGPRCRVPTLEAALANKYGAMLSVGRSPIKRGQDGIDFATMVQHSLDAGRQPIDLEALEKLGEKVWPGGGGQEILRCVELAKTGQIPNLIQTEPKIRDGPADERAIEDRGQGC